MAAPAPNDSFRSLKAITLSRSRPVSTHPVSDLTPRAFPEARKLPAFPLMIRDEMLELYAFKFRQGGFHALGMTFEQFLLVVAAIKPYDLVDPRVDSFSVREAPTEALR